MVRKNSVATFEDIRKAVAYLRRSRLRAAKAVFAQPAQAEHELERLSKLLSAATVLEPGQSRPHGFSVISALFCYGQQNAGACGGMPVTKLLAAFAAVGSLDAKLREKLFQAGIAISMS